MKLINNNISPLPFYDDIAQQNHRKDYAFGQVYPLLTHSNTLLPFQVILPEQVTVTGAKLIDFNTGLEIADLIQSLQANGLSTTYYTTFTVLKYPGILPITEIEHEGLYYITLTIDIPDTGAEQIYSEVFTVTNKVDDYLLLEYGNSYNFELKNGIIDFSDNFKFRCYLNTQIGKPEYNFEEEATERMGYSFIESQVSKKVYKFTFLAPEYLCDALRIVRLCNDKRIISKKLEYDLTAFSMEPEWQEQGDLAAVECEFETDTVIANIGGYELANNFFGGDFNSDFNNDYTIQ